MPENPNKQTPATTNQIESTKPAVPRSFNMLTGPIAATFNAGHYRTIAVKEVMASEKIAVHGAKMYIQVATPKTPAYQKLVALVQAFQVPHTRVMKDYAQFAGQNGGSTNEKIDTLPNFGGLRFPLIGAGQDLKISLQETTDWRDNVYSPYITRVGAGQVVKETDEETPFIEAPPINALLCRGYTAIWNDMLRNKEYDAAREEFDGNEVTDNEWANYTWDSDQGDIDFYTGRARRNNSYFTNYRTELQGYDLGTSEDLSNELSTNDFALNWASYESQFNELRNQAEAAQENPWDTMQKIKGAKKLTEGRVQLLGRKTFPLNYSAITQNAYNNNDQIEEKFRVMGFQGGYSYTEIDLGFLNNIEIVEDGYIHVIITVTAETVFESAVERQFINNHWKSRYRPDLKDDKLDVLYKCEYGTAAATEDTGMYTDTLGFKRRYNEYFKLPTILSGEIYNRGYYQSNHTGIVDTENENRIIPNNTYQFFEYAGQAFQAADDLSILDKKIWLDYTDIMLNKNLAIQQRGVITPDASNKLYGPNQIMLFGEQYCLTDMPIDETIKNNFTKWGEH